MDRLANQGQSEGAGAGDLAKNMQDAPASASASASPLPTSNPNDGSPGKSGGGGLSDSNPGNSGDSDSGEDAVQFDTQLFSFSPVFIADAEHQKKDFTFEASNKTTLEKVTWQVVHNRNVDTLGSYNFKSAKRDFNQFIEVTNTTVSLNFTGETEQFYGDNMQIKIDWTKDGLEGATKSRLFTITNNETEKLELESKLQKDQKQQGPAETTFSPDSSSTSGSIAPTGTTEASDSSGGGGGGGGLSTGATAGIAVGAVIGGLLLIGALVWFLLRRRRNKHPSEDYTIQQTYAVDKEINGRTSDSPNSPYSDENHMQPIALGNVDRDRGVAPTPPPGRSSVASHDRGANSGAQTPQGMSSNVAHLVEDGMTADEIRRLEEEERQLDDEIERAARR